MDRKDCIQEQSLDLADVSLLKSKIREKFYELGIKRKLVEEGRQVVSRLNMEKHNLTQRAEKTERELSEAKIHLHVAIKAAREAEVERSTARELLARQGAQLEAAARDREALQQSNRDIQVYLEELKHELEDTKSKLKSQTHLFELIKEKESQNKSMCDTLSREVEKLEKNQAKLKELCMSITQITKAVTCLLDYQKIQISDSQEEKSKLHREIISLKGQLEDFNSKSEKKIGVEISESFEVWQGMKQDFHNRINDCNNEIDQLQVSLNNALATSAKLQSEELEMNSKLRDLEEKLKKFEESSSRMKNNKEVQTESLFNCLKTQSQDQKNMDVEYIATSE